MHPATETKLRKLYNPNEDPDNVAATVRLNALEQQLESTAMALLNVAQRVSELESKVYGETDRGREPYPSES